MNSDCSIVKHVSRHALLYGCMTLPVGRNAIHCYLRYKINVYDIFNQNLHPGHVIWRHCQTCLAPELEVKSGILKEMLMLRHSNQQQIFNMDELETVIYSLFV